MAQAGTQAECIKVAVRCRPINSDETAKGFKSVIKVDEGAGEILVPDLKNMVSNKISNSRPVTPPNSQAPQKYTHSTLPLVSILIKMRSTTK
jgi:hypothetical protein